MAKKKYPSDTEIGIRTLPQIENLPVRELTDNEVVKLFFRRFDAEAIVMAYVDKDGINGVFGRLRREQTYQGVYEKLCLILDELDLPYNVEVFD